MRKYIDNKGFTITDVLVALTALILLAGVFLPTLSKAQITSRRTICQFNLKNFSMATEVYTQDNDSFYICGLPGNSSESRIWMGSEWSRFLEPYISDTEVFNCPSANDDIKNSDISSYAYSMSFYHSKEQINQISDYKDTFGKAKNIPPVRQKTDFVKKPSQKIIFGEWNSNHALIDCDNGWWNWNGKRNFIFADSHTAFLDAEKINRANDGLPDANLTIDGIEGSDYN